MMMAVPGRTTDDRIPKRRSPIPAATSECFFLILGGSAVTPSKGIPNEGLRAMGGSIGCKPCRGPRITEAPTT